MWHYQVIKTIHGYNLVEAYEELDEDSPLYGTNYSEPLLENYETVEEMVHDLKLMLKDIKEYPPITEGGLPDKK